MDVTQAIRTKAKELLEQKAVQCVIGYEMGTDGVNARPAFIYEPAEVGRLIFNDTCGHNLVTYLRNKKGKKTAVVVKPCDSRAINLLLGEHQIKREEVYIIGVTCSGVVDRQWGVKSPQFLPACQLCTNHNPALYDHLAGEPVAEAKPAKLFTEIEEFEKLSPQQRAEFWQKEFQRCIRCYACRQTCPGCYCTECFVDRLEPEWVGIKIATPQNWMWHAIRAFHLSGRCVECEGCRRACPVDIRLDLLNHKLAREVDDLFKFRSGMSAETLFPLATFVKDEKLGVGE